MCIILLPPVPKGNGSKYVMHVIRLYKNRPSLQSISTDLLKPFRTIHNKHTEMTCASTSPEDLTVHLSTVGQTDSGDCQSRLQLYFSTKHVVCVCVLQRTADFSLVKSDTGEIVTEDGRSRCPFNPEYKSTAIMAGRSQNGCQLSIKSSCVYIL